MTAAPSFLAALEELLNPNLSDKPEEDCVEFVSFTAKELVKRLYSINPYLQVSKEAVENLEQIYRQTWQRIKKTQDIKSTLHEFHYPELSKWVAKLYPEEFQERLRLSPGIGHVAYGEYSAELQIELLGIDTAHIKPPIIDIGCGSQANLVVYFRSLGIEAHGIDRSLETHKPYLTRMDWLDYCFEPNRWGTIVSNMGFTNHLNYAYLHDYSQLERYLLKMKEIVESLTKGGYFYYAPSLPFVEDRLSTKNYKVARERKVSDTFVSMIIRIE